MGEAGGLLFSLSALIWAVSLIRSNRKRGIKPDWRTTAVVFAISVAISLLAAFCLVKQSSPMLGLLFFAVIFLGGNGLLTAVVVWRAHRLRTPAK